MRLVLRFIVLGIFILVVLFLSVPTAKPMTRVRKIRGKLPHRIVSFGDAYSINALKQFSDGTASTGLVRKKKRSPAHETESVPNKANPEMLKLKLDALVENFPDIETPETWTSRLCQRLACDFHHNFACGNKAAVDNKIYFSKSRNNTEAVDFENQLKKWTEFEQLKKYEEAGETLFTVWFGISDVLEYAQLPIEEGVDAVAKSIKSLFSGLTYISEHWSSKSRILIPYTIDITLLPAFSKLLDRASDPDRVTEIQRNAIFLSNVWNQGMELTAEKWTGGQLFLWDVSQWFTSEVRAGNAWSANEGVGGFGSGKGFAKGQSRQKGGWTDVKNPCVQRRQGRWSVCKESDGWLMWDDFRLGARAHDQLANNAYKLVKDSWAQGDSVLNVPKQDDIKLLWGGSRGAKQPQW